jgi:CelD/BcsL family acetyltransferase involved in cellulose biosynthesis
VHGTIDSMFHVEWRPLAELAPIAEQWRALASSALEPNVFYEPAFALAAQPAFGNDVGVGLVWSRTTPARLLGFFPARIERHRWGLTLPVLVGWTHAFGPLGTPLIARDIADGVIAAWLDHLATDPRLPKLALLPYLPRGPVARAITAAVARRRGWITSYAHHRRALLEPAHGRAGYLERSVASKKRKELRRQKRRLRDASDVLRISTGDGSDIDAALQDFFALEAAGWKGRAGTAAHADPQVRAFFTSAVSALAAEGKARIDRLVVGSKPIAAIITLRSGAIAWCWKTAYDETFSRSSPGVQLLLEVSQRLLDDESIARSDSCATPDHPMIDHIWRERLTLSDQIISVGGGYPFVCACLIEGSRRLSVALAKSLRHLARR